MYGRGELTWEWEEGIRSYLHPLLCSVPLALLKITGLDTQYLVIVAPKLLQVGNTLIYCCLFIEEKRLVLFYSKLCYLII